MNNRFHPNNQFYSPQQSNMIGGNKFIIMPSTNQAGAFNGFDLPNVFHSYSSAPAVQQQQMMQQPPQFQQF